MAGLGQKRSHQASTRAIRAKWILTLYSVGRISFGCIGFQFTSKNLSNREKTVLTVFSHFGANPKKFPTFSRWFFIALFKIKHLFTFSVKRYSVFPTHCARGNYYDTEIAIIHICCFNFTRNTTPIVCMYGCSSLVAILYAPLCTYSCP